MDTGLKVFVLSVGISLIGLTMLSPRSSTSRLHGLPTGAGSTSDGITVVDQDLMHGHRVYKDTHRDDLMDFVRTGEATAHAYAAQAQAQAPAPALSDVPIATSRPFPRPAPLEALLRKRSGLYAGGATPRPGWAKNTVLVTASNYEYKGLLKNWECHVAKYDLDWVVVAMDPKLHEFLGPDRSMLVRGEHFEKSVGAFRSKQFNAITCNKFSAVVEILQTGRNVVFSDPDNVWAADPFKDEGFGGLGGMMRSDRYDFLYSVNFFPSGADNAEARAHSKREAAFLADGQEAFYDKRGTMGNTGMYWIRSTLQNIEMLNYTVSECAGNTGWDDQTHLWQNVIKDIKRSKLPAPHYRLTDHCTKKGWDGPKPEQMVATATAQVPLRYCHLDLGRYVTGVNVTWEGLRTYHANFVSGRELKIDKLRHWNPKPGLYMVNDAGTECEGPDAPAASQVDPPPNLSPVVPLPRGTGSTGSSDSSDSSGSSDSTGSSDSSGTPGGEATPAAAPDGNGQPSPTGQPAPTGSTGYPIPNGGREVTAFALANLGTDMPPVPPNKRDGMQASSFAQLEGCCSSGAELAARLRGRCADRTKGWYLTFEVGDRERLAYGASNQLITTANVVQKAWRENRTLVWPVSKKPPIITNHGAFFLDMLRVRFDMSEFFATFCIITADQMPPPELQKDVVHMNSNVGFYDYTSYKDKTGYLLFRGIIFISIFANPRAEIRAAVANFQKEQLGPRYVAVHLRMLEPSESKFLQEVRRRGPDVVDEMREQYVMSTEYVTKKRAEAGLGADVPIFVGTDNKRSSLTEALVTTLGARRFTATDHPLLKDTPETRAFASSEHRQAMDEAMVDFLLMMNSTLFIGNDASTVSWNVVADRRTRGIYTDNIHGPEK